MMRLNAEDMRAVLAQAPITRIDEKQGVLIGTRVDRSDAIIELPTPDGEVERFRFVEQSVMHPTLQAKFPSIRTYIGQGIDRPAATLHFDSTPLGFHAQVIGPASARGIDRATADMLTTYAIDPISRGDALHHVAYFVADLPDQSRFTCDADGPAIVPVQQRVTPRGPGGVPLRVLRLACAATGEYTAYHSAPNPSNQVAGIAAVATCVNRINQVYMRDLGVQLMLAENNDSIIFTNALTDPYSPPAGSPTGTWPVLNDIQPQNPGVIAANISAGAYDLGHVVHALPSGPGLSSFSGRAAIGGVCGPNASLAASTSALPNGTYFWISVVAHEIGHQLGASHSFNGIFGSCGNPNQYTSSSAIEPGSGTTIMSYAGNCNDSFGDDNIVYHNPFPGPGTLAQSAALPMFNTYNINQVEQTLAVNTCGFDVQTGNRRPFVPITAPSAWTIPANTPFRLNCSAGDPDSEQQVTVSWEQFNLGAQRALGPDTSANEPLFRTFLPTTDSDRYFPVLATTLGSAPLRGENLPRFDRTMLFRAVSRDNFAQGGGTNSATVTVGVVRTLNDLAFRVTAPVTSTQFCAGQSLTVQWDTVGTQNPPVNAGFVDITLSLDGGQTWPMTLAANVPNNGQAIVTVPALNTTQGRIKVEPTQNIFFAISPGNLSVSSAPPSVAVEPSDLFTCPRATPATIGFTPGAVPASVQWYKDGVALPGETNAQIAFLSLTPADTGDYSARLTNGCGEVTTRTMRLQVGVSVDSVTPIPSTLNPCSVLALTAQARGVGALTYRWQRNGQFLVDGNGISGALTPTLRFPGGVRFEHEGEYSVVVTDQCNSQTRSAGRIELAGPFWVQKSVTPAPSPSGSDAARFTGAYDESRGVTVIYGGITFTGQPTNSLWEFDGVTWSGRVDGYNGVVPQPGQDLYFNNNVAPTYATACYSPDHHAVFIACSAGLNGPLKIWKWNGVNWTTVASRDGSGDAASLLVSAYDRNRHRLVIISVGGNGGNEVLEFDPSTNAFTVGPNVPIATPLLLSSGHAYYDDARGQVMLFGPRSNFTPPVLFAYNGAWQALSGVPLAMHEIAPWAYDPIRRQAVVAGANEAGPTCGLWNTATFAFPGSPARFSPALPAASDWSGPLPDGPPRNPAGAGQSPDNAYAARVLAFDRVRRAMVSIGGRGISSFSCGQPTWDMWERRYLDAVVFDRQPPSAPTPVNQVLTLNASPAGFGPLSLRWTRDGLQLSDGLLPGFPSTTVSGSTTPTLTVTGPGASQAATFRLLATNSCGTQSSSPATVGMPILVDFDGNGVRTVDDIFIFLNAWFAHDLRTDADGNGSLSIDDIFVFLNAWFACC
jgi:hypothetical protein